MRLDTHELHDLGSDFVRGAGAVGAGTAKVVKKTAFDIERDAKGEVRVDTGFLKGSISTSFEGDGRFGTMTAEIGPTADYGIWQEIGTSTQPGHAYLAPAFDRRLPQLEAGLGALGLDVLR